MRRRNNLNSLIRTEAPAEPVLSLAEARRQCRVDAWGSPPVHVDDDLLEAYVQAATDELDGVDGWLNRALVTQTWKLTLDHFPASATHWHWPYGHVHHDLPDGAMFLPLPPLQEVTSIKYDDPDGVEQTLDPSDYQVFTDADPGYIAPKVNGTWPNTQAARGAVRITYVAGYGDAADVPEIVKNYIRVRVGQLYNFRELTVMKVGAPQPVPFMRDSLESIRMRGVKP